MVRNPCMHGVRRVMHGLRALRCRTVRDDRQGAVHHQRGQLHVRKRFALLLRSRDEAGRERNFLSRQRIQTGRCGAVDGDPRRHRLGRGQQFGGHLRHRYQYVQGGGTHHGPYLAALHPFPERRKGLRHPNLGSAHLHRQPQDLRNHGVHRDGYGFRDRFDGADGAVRQVRIHQLLVLPEPDSGDRYRDRHRLRRDHGGHSADLAGHGQIQQDLDGDRRRLREFALRP